VLLDEAREKLREYFLKQLSSQVISTEHSSNDTQEEKFKNEKAAETEPIINTLREKEMSTEDSTSQGLSDADSDIESEELNDGSDSIINENSWRHKIFNQMLNSREKNLMRKQILSLTNEKLFESAATLGYLKLFRLESKKNEFSMYPQNGREGIANFIKQEDFIGSVCLMRTDILNVYY